MTSGKDNSTAYAITGMGAVSALGCGCEALWEAVAAGRDGIGPVTRFSTETLSVHLGAEVSEEDGAWTERHRCVCYGLAATREAWSQARVEEAGLSPERIALVLGTSVGYEQIDLQRYAEEVADELGIRGPRLTVSTACSSSCNALGLGRDLLRAGMADLVVAGGVDELTPEVFAGFHALRILSAQKCAPFSHPVGTTLGEGAGFLVLEPVSQALARDAEVLALLSGYGLAGDAHHETAPDPKGEGMARAMGAALTDAGLAPSQVAYVNAHGTGTAANDQAEWAAVRKVFGAASLPTISSTKSQLGHTQGASGALETITTILALRRGLVPPTVHFVGARHGCPEDPVAGASPRPLPVRHALCANAAFGGANAVVVVSAPDARTAPVPATRPVRVVGVGTVGPHGLTGASLEAALGQGAPLQGRVPDFRVDSLVRGVDPRGMDPATRFLTAAAHASLQDAGIRMRGTLRERAGIVVGATGVSASSAVSFLESIEQRGLARLSATAFARMVLNAAAGACSMHLSLKGPTSTLCTGPGSGMAAVVYGAMLLAGHPEAELMVAGGVDERGPAERRGEPLPRGLPEAEGAACLLLGAGEVGADDADPIWVAGWGVAGPERLSRAVDVALRRARLAPDELDAVYGSPQPGSGAGFSGAAWHDVAPVIGWAAASGACQAAVAAVLALRRGEGQNALVLSSDGESACTALVLTRGELRHGC